MKGLCHLTDQSAFYATRRHTTEVLPKNNIAGLWKVCSLLTFICLRAHGYLTKSATVTADSWLSGVPGYGNCPNDLVDGVFSPAAVFDD